LCGKPADSYNNKEHIKPRQTPGFFFVIGEDDVYNQQDAHGFIQLFGLPLKVEALLAIN